MNHFLPTAATAVSLFIFCCSASGARIAYAASDELSPVGVWSSEGDDSHIEIEKCGIHLCGSIVWLKDPLGPDGKDAIDSNNPDPALRKRRLVGLPLLSAFEQSSTDPAQWTDGRIYDPDDGRTYSCKITVVDRNSLRLRGYFGISLFGKNQIWTRVK